MTIMQKGIHSYGSFVKGFQGNMLNIIMERNSSIIRQCKITHAIKNIRYTEQQDCCTVYRTASINA